MLHRAQVAILETLFLSRLRVLRPLESRAGRALREFRLRSRTCRLFRSLQFLLGRVKILK